MQGPHHRAPEVPPLLRRHRTYERMKAQDHQVRGPHDHARPKVSRSAFARSRYRRDLSGSHSRRSSVYVPGEHGNTYLVSRAPSGNTDRRSSHSINRRQADESNMVLGRIDIMASSFPRPIASFSHNLFRLGCYGWHATYRIADGRLDPG